MDISLVATILYILHLFSMLLINFKRSSFGCDTKGFHLTGVDRTHNHSAMNLMTEAGEEFSPALPPHHPTPSKFPLQSIDATALAPQSPAPPSREGPTLNGMLRYAKRPGWIPH